MNASPDHDMLVATAKRYAVDRTTRSETRSSFDQLAGLADAELQELVDELRRSEDENERALAVLLTPRLSPDAAEARLAAAFDADESPEVLSAAAEAVSSVPGPVWSPRLARL